MTISERNKFIMENYSLILKCVGQCHVVNGEAQDMIQDAVVQVLKVIDRFDPDKGSFSTFIWPEIKQYVYRQNCGMADRTFKMACKISKAREALEKTSGNEPSEEQIALALNMKTEELREEISRIEKYNSISLDSKTEDGDDDLYNLDFGQSSYNPESECIGKIEKELIQNSWKMLSEKEKSVIELRYNLSGKNESEYSLRKTAEKLEMSHETVRVTEKHALQKMKKALEEQGFAA